MILYFIIISVKIVYFGRYKKKVVENQDLYNNKDDFDKIKKNSYCLNQKILYLVSKYICTIY